MRKKENLDTIIQAIPKEQRDNIIIEARIERPNASSIVFDIISKDDLQRLREVYKTNDEAMDTEQQTNKILSGMEALLEQKLKTISAPQNLSDETHITVKQFTQKYKMSDDTQRIHRAKHKDPLPYFQFSDKGNVTYDVKLADKWYENYKITKRQRKK